MRFYNGILQGFLVMAIALTGLSSNVRAGETATAVFAAGCFWCIEKDLEHVEGVGEVISGYIGGHVDEPSYKQVSRGGTGHYEAVQVIYDPSVVSYQELLKAFWVNVDPHDAKGQFCDKGDQYRAAIFYQDDEEQKQAIESKKELEESDRLSQPIVTEILPVATFWKAEFYHQNYYKKNPVRYNFYRSRCGRDKRLKAVWGDIDINTILQ